MAHHQDDDDHDRGLAFDLRTLSRRRMFGWMAGATAGLALAPTLIGCDSGDDAGAVDAAGSTDAAGGTCTTIPEETAGPYPGDGSNGANALAISGIVRSDIRTSFGTASGTAAGVPLTITLTLVDSNNGCAPLVGYALYLWHCDRDGNYSMYTGTAAAQNYLRGVQTTDASGQVTFTSIFPACYSGRWPHVHFEIWPSVASSSAGKIATSQLALPQATCNTVYATSGYEQSVTNLAQISLATDNVFRDDSAVRQLATVTGSVAAGYTATLTVPVAA